jgi:uncharacterized membrane protein
MKVPSLVWGSPQWFAAVAALAGVAAVLLLWSYARAQGRPGVRLAAATLKAIGFAALLLCLVEPLLTGSKPKRGANAFVVLADNSQSMLIRDGQDGVSRGDWLRDRLGGQPSSWKTRLEQDFDVRRYAFDSHLRAVDGFNTLTFDGVGSSLNTSLQSLAKRFRGLPIAGVLVFTDGTRTDAGDIDASQLPPIYPVVPPSRGAARDIAVRGVAISQTNFEAAPVVLRADVSATGYRGESIVAVITDESGKDVERLESIATSDDKPLAFRFQFRPEKKGLSFYRVRAFALAEERKQKDAGGDPTAGEQTSANNSRLVVVDQGGGPYRVLYVSGRPNWEYKFLRRSLDGDDQIDLVGMIRIARKQPKFDFRSNRNNATSPFYDGFDLADPDLAERSDQPVLVRLNTRDGDELRDGFPKSAEELYQYHAIVLDDLESAFFTPDQLALLRNFVSQRGGGFLMLGGPDSFAEGKYDRTPIGDLLPVYLDRPTPADGIAEYRLALTAEGWLQPWVRLRKTEDEDQKRLAGMPPFLTLNQAGRHKPGAVTLAEVRDASGKTAPALVAQPFGKGRTAALLIGDLWHWEMRRADPADVDFERAWRQMIRWLVADVPTRVEVSARPKADATSPAVDIRVRVRDAEYRPLDNAKVALKITLPGGENLALDAEPEGREAGTYAATYVTRQPGPYRVMAIATAPDGAAVGQREAGWAAQPSADEFARLQPDREWLESIAARTKGDMVDGDRLEAFVSSLSSRDAPITEPWISPLWHQPLYFLVAIACLAAEWGIRRVHGLP